MRRLETHFKLCSHGIETSLLSVYFSVYSNSREGLKILINLKFLFHFNSVYNSLILIIDIYRTVMKTAVHPITHLLNIKVSRVITNTARYLPSIVESDVVH
jgi:hypothetical protein